MQIQIGGWKKIYLYYGLIFFGLGLLGFSLNNRVNLSQLVKGALFCVSQELSGLGLIPSGAIQEVSVSHSGLLPVVFIYPNRTGDPQYETLRGQILAKLEERNSVIGYSVPMPEWYRSPQVKPLLSNGRFLVGLTFSANEASFEVPSIIFSIPKPMTAEFLNCIINQETDFPLFKLELLTRGQNCLYRLSFGKSRLSSEHFLKVLDILLDLWERAGLSGRRGNYLETFW